MGTWALERRIDDQASMTGVATITRREDGMLEYTESGRLRLADGQEFDAGRRYIFRPHPDGLTVLFAEEPPRLFHHVGLAEESGVLRGDAIHVCGNDCYKSAYAFLPDGSFIIRHEVSGPRKNYSMHTRYTHRP